MSRVTDLQVRTAAPSDRGDVEPIAKLIHLPHWDIARMQLQISSAATQKISELLRESELSDPVPSLCDVVFDDQGSDALNSVHDQIGSAGATAEELSLGMAELKLAVESACGHLWINVFERADYDQNDLVRLDGIELAIPLAMRSWLTDSALVFEFGKFYLRRSDGMFESLFALASDSSAPRAG